VKPKPKSQQKPESQKPSEAKTKSQKPKAKSQVGTQMGDFSSKVQQIARKSEILAPKCSK